MYFLFNSVIIGVLYASEEKKIGPTLLTLSINNNDKKSESNMIILINERWNHFSAENYRTEKNKYKSYR